MDIQQLEHAELSLQSVEVKNKHAAITAKIKPMQAELASLNARVRTSQTHRMRLMPEEYRSICNRQTVLKRRISELEVEAEPLKARLREIGALSTIYYATREDERKVESASQILPIGDELLRAAIVTLRGQWLAFAEDQTRVNSMRVIAAQFSRELTDILAIRQNNSTQ